jgi:ketosteroid isomerase-like protein
MLRALRLAAFLLLPLIATGCTTPPAGPADRATLVRQVTEAETAFAKTMADRDHAAFTGFLAEDAVFFSGREPLRGKAAVAAFWKRFYESPKAPFSWKPAKVEVLPDGRLAMSTGPVFDPDGKPVASFTSVWRLESPGVWRIVFDNGCNCPP